MLTTCDSIIGREIGAAEESVGAVKDIYFEDAEWGVRYFVVDTGGWFHGRKVLISPAEVGFLPNEEEMLPVSLTRKRIEEAPSISTALPLSLHNELVLAKYHGWIPSWQPGPLRGPLAQGMAREEPPEAREAVEEAAQSRLRSVKEISGYDVHATDGQIGQVMDFLIDTDEWAIRYLIADTARWLPSIRGRRVVLSLQWIREISWAERSIFVTHARDEVADSPEFNPDAPIDRDYETSLHKHYREQAYWHRTPAAS